MGCSHSIILGAVINFADKSIVGLAAVPIMKEFNLTYAEWGLVGSSYYWLYPVTGIFGAAWADRLGAKKVLGFIMLTWTVLQFGVLAITALPLLILYRILLGAFEGPYSPIAYSHADKWFPPKLKGFANSVVVGGGTVGAMIVAPILVSLITDIRLEGCLCRPWCSKPCLVLPLSIFNKGKSS